MALNVMGDAAQDSSSGGGCLFLSDYGNANWFAITVG